MRFLDYIFYRAYFHYKHFANDGAVLGRSILYTCFICDRILFPIYSSLEWLCLGRVNSSYWQDLIIESPILIYLTHRYITKKDKILKIFNHHKYSKIASYFFMFTTLIGMCLITLILEMYLQSQILKRGLEGTWNIPEFFSNFVGVWDC